MPDTNAIVERIMQAVHDAIRDQHAIMAGEEWGRGVGF